MRLVHATSAAVSRVETVQDDRQQGPGLDAFRGAQSAMYRNKRGIRPQPASPAGVASSGRTRKSRAL
jgi:hypothetical protein